MNSTNVPPNKSADVSLAELLAPLNPEQLKALGTLFTALQNNGPAVVDGLSASDLRAVCEVGDAFRETLADGRLMNLVSDLQKLRANNTQKAQSAVEKARVYRAERIEHAGRLAAQGSADFWQYLDNDEEDFTPFPHELIALRATTALFDNGVLSRKWLFNTDDLGFVDIMRTIAEAVVNTLPDIIDEGDGAHWLVALAVGRPEQVAQDGAE
jgi:hypothetical protein